MTHEATPAQAGPVTSEAVARSQQQWRRERRYLNEHRCDLEHAAGSRYLEAWRVAGTPLLARPEWLPADPVPLEAVTLSWHPGPPGAVIDPVQPPGSLGVRPLRADGARFPSYADALAALDRPRLLENRTCYRLLGAVTPVPPGDPATCAHLAFGLNRYFDLINVSEAVAHETAAWVLAHPDRAIGPRPDELPLRSAIGDPLDLARRSVTAGIATLILRLDREAGTAQMLLHWRDPASVAVNGGLYQVAPAGMFQPSGEARGNLANDLSLWRAIAREVSEELLGTSEDYGSDQAPIDYERWPFFAALSGARQAGTLRGYWLGAGADPLTLDVDLLTVLVFDAELFDAEFGGLVSANEEGHILTGGTGEGAAAPGEVGIEFSAANVDRFTSVEAIQPAGAAILRLAWRHRDVLLGG
jgi:hypothetical protein